MDISFHEFQPFSNFSFCSDASKVKNSARESSLEAVFGNIISNSSRAKALRQQKSLNDHLAEQVGLIHRDFVVNILRNLYRAKENRLFAI